MNSEFIKHKIEHNKERLLTTVKWVIFSLLVGLVLGVIGAVFYHGIKDVTAGTAVPASGFSAADTAYPASGAFSGSRS